MLFGNVGCSLTSSTSHDKFSCVFKERGPREGFLEYFHNCFIQSKVAAIGISIATVQDTTHHLFRKAPPINPIPIQFVKERFFPHIVFDIGKEPLSWLVGQSYRQHSAHLEVLQITIPLGSWLGYSEQLLIRERVIKGELFSRSVAYITNAVINASFNR